ncbi:MAG: hypothetical protein ACTSVU_04865 [Promethearchaeota archaeon]
MRVFNHKLYTFLGLLILSISALNSSFFNVVNASKTPVASQGDTTERFRLEQNGVRFYVTYLNSSETWSVNCTSTYNGKYYLFLFDERPKSTYILNNNSLDIKVYDDAIAYNNTPVEVFSKNLNSTVYSTTLNYTATKYTLYYLEVVLVEGGPDTFLLDSSNKEITPYYIPYIPGYPLEILNLAVIISLSLILFRKWKKNLISK